MGEVIHSDRNRRDHHLRGALEKVVKDTIQAGGDLETLINSILVELDDQNIIDYAPKSAINLLTPSGRLLALLMNKPGLSVREMATSLGVTQQAITKGLVSLAANRLVARTKVSGRYVYQIDTENAAYHPDLKRLILMVAKISSTQIGNTESRGE